MRSVFLGIPTTSYSGTESSYPPLPETSMSSYLILSYKHSKGTPLPIILKARDDCTCPFPAAKAYLKKRKSKVLEFIWYENGKHVTRSQIAGKLQLTLQVLGKRPASYNIHSFRIGKFLTWLPQAALNYSWRWQSNNAHLPYIQTFSCKIIVILWCPLRGLGASQPKNN